MKKILVKPFAGEKQTNKQTKQKQNIIIIILFLLIIKREREREREKQHTKPRLTGKQLGLLLLQILCILFVCTLLLFVPYDSLGVSQ